MVCSTHRGRIAARPRGAFWITALAALGMSLVGCSDSETDADPGTGSVATQPPVAEDTTTAPSDPPADTTEDRVEEETTTTTTTLPADPFLINTTLGPVQGGPSNVDGVRNFLAIPFAEPPVEENAWRPPVAREPWVAPLDATEPGPSCPQSTEGITTSFVITPDPDPDCLSLSVWTPNDAEGLPVMVWIHGGGLSTGSAHEPYYTGDDLAAEGVVVVNVNYRLGPLGFLATEELRRESDDGAVGNYGFLDQQLALEWVQDNAAAFGGEPDQVTIFGESAGGFAVCGHLAAPGSQGLFARAIIQSGGGCDRLTPLESALRGGASFMEQIRCADMACLRSQPDEALIAAQGFDPSLVADGVTLTGTAYELAESGGLDGIAVFIGSNADEATLFTLSMEEPTDDGLVEAASTLTDDPGALVALYPAEQFTTNKARYQAMFTDVRFTCPTIDFAGVAPEAFVYHYTYISESNPLGLGATHGAELASLFNHLEGITVEVQRTERGSQLSSAIQAAWVSFATTGDPGDSFEPYRDGATVALIDVPIERVDTIRDGRCGQVIELSALQR